MSHPIFPEANSREVLRSFSGAMDGDRIETIHAGLREITDVIPGLETPIYTPLLSYSLPGIGTSWHIDHGKTSLGIEGRQLSLSVFNDVSWHYPFAGDGWTRLTTSVDMSGNDRPPLDILTTFNGGETFFSLSPRVKLAQAFLWLFMDDLNTAEEMVKSYCTTPKMCEIPRMAVAEPTDVRG